MIAHTCFLVRNFHSKALVASRRDTEPLRLRLVRGTTALADHEAALTELCANPDTSDAEAEQCVLEYLQGGCYDASDVDDEVVDESSLCNKDEESECALDEMHNLWAEDLPSQLQQQPKATAIEKAKSPVKP